MFDPPFRFWEYGPLCLWCADEFGISNLISSPFQSEIEHSRTTLTLILFLTVLRDMRFCKFDMQKSEESAAIGFESSLTLGLLLHFAKSEQALELLLLLLQKHFMLFSHPFEPESHVLGYHVQALSLVNSNGYTVVSGGRPNNVQPDISILDDHGFLSIGQVSPIRHLAWKTCPPSQAASGTVQEPVAIGRT